MNSQSYLHSNIPQSFFLNKIPYGVTPQFFTLIIPQLRSGVPEWNENFTCCSKMLAIVEREKRGSFCQHRTTIPKGIDSSILLPQLFEGKHGCQLCDRDHEANDQCAPNKGTNRESQLVRRRVCRGSYLPIECQTAYHWFSSAELSAESDDYAIVGGRPRCE